MGQFPTRGGNSGKPILLSDQQGFDRRWFAPYLKAVYAPVQPDQVAACVTDALVTYGKDVKISSGRHQPCRTRSRSTARNRPRSEPQHSHSTGSPGSCHPNQTLTFSVNAAFVRSIYAPDADFTLGAWEKPMTSSPTASGHSIY